MPTATLACRAAAGARARCESRACVPIAISIGIGRPIDLDIGHLGDAARADAARRRDTRRAAAGTPPSAVASASSLIARERLEVQGVADRSGRPRSTGRAISRFELPAIASNTGCTSVGELAITFRISAVAVCRSSASLVSLNRRTFCDRDHRLVGEGLQQRDELVAESARAPRGRRATAPMTWPSEQHRHRQRRCASRPGRPPTSARTRGSSRMSAICDRRLGQDGARVDRARGSSGIGKAARIAASASGETPW